MNGKPKIYRALLNQSGEFAPVATIFENSIGDIVWTRHISGNFFGTLIGAFPRNKTFLLMASPNSFAESQSLRFQCAEFYSVDAINVLSIKMDLEAASLAETLTCADGFSSNIEILVYP